MAGKCNIERRHGPAVGPGDRFHRYELCSWEWLPGFYDFNLAVGFTTRSKRGDRAKWKRTKAGCLQIRTQARGSFFFFFLSTFLLSPFLGEAGADQQQKRISFNTLEGRGGSGSVFLLLLSASPRWNGCGWLSIAVAGNNV